MGTRGTKSKEDLKTLPVSAIVTIERPEAPKVLTEEEAVLWERTVQDLDEDWFPESSHQVLISYCRQSVRGDKLAQLIHAEERKEELDHELYLKLLARQEACHRTIASLATKLRITQQSFYEKDKKRAPKKLAKPWER